MKRSTQRGFSLIELMATVGILALLASIAVPAFSHLTLRAKLSERSMMIKELEHSVMQYQAEYESFPDDFGGGNSQLWGDFNPPFPVEPTKREFLQNQPGWSALVFRPAGQVYHSYYMFGWQSGNDAWFIVYAYGDLDNDGVLGYKYRYWRRSLGNWRLWGEWDTMTI